MEASTSTMYKVGSSGPEEGEEEEEEEDACGFVCLLGRAHLHVSLWWGDCHTDSLGSGRGQASHYLPHLHTLGQASLPRQS